MHHVEPLAPNEVGVAAIGQDAVLALDFGVVNADAGLLEPGDVRLAPRRGQRDVEAARRQTLA
jgi:hypothetical protein